MSESTERPVLIIANRLPFTVAQGAQGLERIPSSGGLVSAFEPVLERRGGTWVGWPGAVLPPDTPLPGPAAPYRIRPVQLSAAEAQGYYEGFANGTLWPLFHSLTERAAFEGANWHTYERVNERFARIAAEVAGPDDIIWVNDYQLMRVPLHLRRLRPDARIAFFLHIPFPSYDVFRLLPWDRQLLQGMLGADLVGFHVQGYADNFVQCAERTLHMRTDPDAGRIAHGDRTVRVAPFPIGIDFEAYDRGARDAPKSGAGSERIVLGVDRLDYTKGIPQRLRAFERLLELHPEHRGRVALLQIAVPSRDQVGEYQSLKREIDELVGHVNGRFATSKWSPIRYLYRSVEPEQLSQLYRDADVALVTPLRDGMNLVAKEFVASRVERPGVLVLSRLAGAAETMREALLVNPFDIDGSAEEMHRALGMPDGERTTRMEALRRRESRNDLNRWVESFLDAARQAAEPLAGVTPDDFDRWLGPMLRKYRLALFLDYDGTLSPIRDHPDQATLDADTRSALTACAARSDTDVAIVSGRALADVAAQTGVPDLLYAGNHGLEMRGPGIEDFAHRDLEHYRERLAKLAARLREVASEGAWVEDKRASLTFHYRGADPGSRAALAETVRAAVRAAGFQPRDALFAVEARPPIGWDKGHAVLHVLRTRYGPEWSASVRPIYVGDDETDEDAFRSLSGLGRSFRVGSADLPTAADRHLPNPEAVRTLLEYLAARSD